MDDKLIFCLEFAGKYFHNPNPTIEEIEKEIEIKNFQKNMENLGRYFICTKSIENFKKGKLYRLVYGEEMGVMGYKPEFVNKYFRDATEKEIQEELEYIKGKLDQRTKETLVVVQKMVKDGQISQDVAEKYFPQLREYEANKEEKILKNIKLCLEECVHNDIIRDYEKDSILKWIDDKTKGIGNPYSGVSFDWNNHTYGFCVRDGEINILIDGKLVGGYTPNFIPTKKKDWKPSSEDIKLLEQVQKELLGKDCHNAFTNLVWILKKL